MKQAANFLCSSGGNGVCRILDSVVFEAATGGRTRLNEAASFQFTLLIALVPLNRTIQESPAGFSPFHIPVGLQLELVTFS